MSFIDKLQENFEDNTSVLVGGKPLNRPCYEKGPIFPDGEVGIELEIEGQRLPSGATIADLMSKETQKYWAAVNDGSLRGGLEYVLTGPIKTSEVRQMVDGLFNKFKENGSKIKNSNRCSTHVHVNVSDLKVNELTSVISLWCTFQTPFIKWWGEERVSNHFCLSSRDEESMVSSWIAYLKCGQLNMYRTRDGLKYTALNILPIFSQGSIEFRAGGPPNDPDKVVYWAKICNAIVRYAVEHFKNPLALGYALSEQGPEELLMSILVKANLGPITCQNIYQELTEDGQLTADAFNDFRDVQALLYSFPWDNYMGEFYKEIIPDPFETKTVKYNNLLFDVFEPANPAIIRQQPEERDDFDDDE